MARTLFQYSIMISVIYAINSQNVYNAPIEITIRDTILDLSSQQERYLPPQVYRAVRSDTCSQHPGSKCTFVLLCIMSGGVASGPCSGGLLSTCCIPSNPGIKRFTLPPSQSFASNLITDQKVISTQSLSSAVKKAKKISENSTSCGIAHLKPQSRIIGGNNAMYGEFPWQAHIKLNRQQCGGVLLNKYYVLTAAHCIYQVRLPDITIQLGVYDIQDHTHQASAPQTFSVEEKKIHPRFKYQAAHPDRFDVALLKLDRAAKYQENVVPICLPRKGWDFHEWIGIITGWGKTENGIGNRYGTSLLQKVEVPIISNEKCEKWHREKGIDITIASEMMCAGYEDGKKDACVGDSGGPLIVVVQGRWTVVGIVSAGFGCAQSRQPGIYHRVAHTVDWLRENIST